MTAQDIVAQLGIDVTTNARGPAYGYFWCNAVSPDWHGPEDSREDAQRAAIKNLLYYVEIGKAYASTRLRQVDDVYRELLTHNVAVGHPPTAGVWVNFSDFAHVIRDVLGGELMPYNEHFCLENTNPPHAT